MDCLAGMWMFLGLSTVCPGDLFVAAAAATAAFDSLRTKEREREDNVALIGVTVRRGEETRSTRYFFFRERSSFFALRILDGHARFSVSILGRKNFKQSQKRDRKRSRGGKSGGQ